MEETYVLLDEIILPRKWQRILQRDHGQIEEMRRDFESGRVTRPVILRRRFDGKFVIQDGRHRVLAAHLAREPGVEAVIH